MNNFFVNVRNNQKSSKLKNLIMTQMVVNFLNLF